MTVGENIQGTMVSTPMPSAQNSLRSSLAPIVDVHVEEEKGDEEERRNEQEHEHMLNVTGNAKEDACQV